MDHALICMYCGSLCDGTMNNRFDKCVECGHNELKPLLDIIKELQEYKHGRD